MSYRPDIDGMRALAILAVVLFHAKLGPFYGGFVGVDVFFVISGYLITGLIAKRLDQGRFSFWDFYARRTRRIFPALFVMIALVLVAGYFILTPGEYETLGQSAAFSSVFLANVYFWLNTGYFDQPAETMPLLHIWSIAVEEQFYFVWPLTLFVIWKIVRAGNSAIVPGLIAATIALFVLCIALTARDASAAFYLPFARFWEFTLGALVFFLPPLRDQRLANGLSLVGFAAVLGAIFFFDDKLAYPGYYAALPCAGAAAMIAAGERSLVGRLLAVRPSVFIGKVSYSFYLWHWPVLVFYAHYSGPKFSLEEKLSLVALAFVLSIVSWRFVETPIRRLRGVPWRHVGAGATVAASAVVASVFVAANAGFPSRLPEELRPLGSAKAMMAFNCTEDIALPADTAGDTHCIVGAPWSSAARHVVIWGDSHAQHLLPLLDILAREQNLSIAYWPGCPPFIDDEAREIQLLNRGTPAEFCLRSQREVLDWIAKSSNLDLVIVANAWASYPRNLVNNNNVDRTRAFEIMEQGLVQAIKDIDPKRHPILILGDVPRPGLNIPKCLMRNAPGLLRSRPCRRVKDAFTEDPRESEEILKRLAAGDGRIFFHDSLAEMCRGPQACPARVGGEIIYRDRNHLRHDLNIDTRQEIVSMLKLKEALDTALGTTLSRRAGGPRIRSGHGSR